MYNGKGYKFAETINLILKEEMFLNLVFHTAFSISTSSVLSKNIEQKHSTIKYLVMGFIGNILVHGVMDLIPHNYPIQTKFDILFSVAMFLLTIIIVNKKFVPMGFCCFLGGALPDIIDKGLFRIMHTTYRTLIYCSTFIFMINILLQDKP